jgi:hypothetical protein
MTQRYRRSDPLAEIDSSQHEEIRKYKWLESEKAGKDIGWERARREWLAKHFPSWKQNRWQQALNEAMQIKTGLN